ncbi:MAG: FAD-dependent oxidoreductase, partial [Oscillospiraceae bacterium]
MLDAIVIGCGIIGAATAYELSQYRLSVAVLEAENDVSTGTTKANSAILHAGYDPKPGSMMAKLNVNGSRM